MVGLLKTGWVCLCAPDSFLLVHSPMRLHMVGLPCQPVHALSVVSETFKGHVSASHILGLDQNRMPFTCQDILA
jgi:uncharacterized NAD-dependent epimerase/dehydratase family protein